MTDVLPAAYADLSPMMREFVRLYVETGGRDASRAAALAGYSMTANGHRVAAHRLLRDPRVLAALRYEIDTKIKAGAVLAMATLLELAQKASTDGVRFQAAQAVMDRAGLLVAKVPSEHHVVVEDRRTTQELIAYIKAHAPAVLGIEAPIDVEYAEVPNETADDGDISDLLEGIV